MSHFKAGMQVVVTGNSVYHDIPKKTQLTLLEPYVDAYEWQGKCWNVKDYGVYISENDFEEYIMTPDVNCIFA